MVVLLTIIIIALVGYISVLHTMHHFERKDLYTRIMSKDLADYKVNTGPIKHTKAKNFIKEKFTQQLKDQGYS